MRRWCSTVVHSIMCGFEKVTSSILHQYNWTPRTDRKRSVWRDSLCSLSETTVPEYPQASFCVTPDRSETEFMITNAIYEAVRHHCRRRT